MDRVQGIRITNHGVFTGDFYANCPRGKCAHHKSGVQLGQTCTLEGFGWGTQVWGPDGPGARSVYPNPGEEMWPVVDVVAGKWGHEAGDNVIYDPTANAIALYDCTGTTYTPQFSYGGTVPFSAVQALAETVWNTVQAAAQRQRPYQNFLIHTGTPIPSASSGDFAAWGVADTVDNDGKPDLFGVRVANTQSGSVELYMLSASSNFQALATTPTVFAGVDHANFAAWGMADFDGNGTPDLYGVKVRGTAGDNVELHVASSASGFKSWLLQTPTAFSAVDGSTNFSAWGVADLDHDGKPDLYGVKVRSSGSGKAELHAVSNASGFQSWIVHAATSMPADTAAVGVANWSVAQFGGDGALDLFAIRTGGTVADSTEVHVLDGGSNWQSSLLDTPTGISAADGSGNFGAWALGLYGIDDTPDLYGVKVRNTGTNTVELHVLEGFAPSLPQPV